MWWAVGVGRGVRMPGCRFSSCAETRRGLVVLVNNIHNACGASCFNVRGTVDVHAGTVGAPGVRTLTRLSDLDGGVIIGSLLRLTFRMLRRGLGSRSTGGFSRVRCRGVRS